MTMDSERIIEIESKLVYLEDTVQQLNTVVCRQQDQIDRLEATGRLLADRIEELTEGSTAEQDNEPPPHY
jgi:SlyX protein